jgi:hypothetical protein
MQGVGLTADGLKKQRVTPAKEAGATSSERKSRWVNA